MMRNVEYEIPQSIENVSNDILNGNYMISMDTALYIWGSSSQ